MAAAAREVLGLRFELLARTALLVRALAEPPAACAAALEPLAQRLRARTLPAIGRSLPPNTVRRE